MHDTVLFLRKEVAGAAKMISYEVVKDDDQHDGDSPRQEGGYPDYDSRVGLITVTTSWQRHILPIHSQVNMFDDIDPGQWHREEMGHKDNSHAGQFSDPGLGEVLLGSCAAENKVSLDGEHHHDPGGAVQRSVLQESQNAAPGVGVPERLKQPEGEGQVNENDPHQVEGVHNGQTAQVDNGCVGHPTFTEADHIEREEVGWRTKQE